jgi:hypothetical protein
MDKVTWEGWIFLFTLAISLVGPFVLLKRAGRTWLRALTGSLLLAAFTVVIFLIVFFFFRQIFGGGEIVDLLTTLSFPVAVAVVFACMIRGGNQTPSG